MNTVSDFENMVTDFFSNPENTRASQKTRSRMRAVAGRRKEKLKIKNFSKLGKVEVVVKSPDKFYHRLNEPQNEKDADIKKRCNRSIRRTTGDIVDGAAYKNGSAACEEIGPEVLYAECGQ